MSLKVLFLILFTISLSACAQLVLKLGVSAPRFKSALHVGGGDLVYAALASPHIWAGMLMYASGMVCWIWVLSKVELSVAYPFVGLSFILTMLFGVFLLNEHVTLARALGTILIAVGCVLVGRSA